MSKAVIAERPAPVLELPNRASIFCMVNRRGANCRALTAILTKGVFQVAHQLFKYKSDGEHFPMRILLFLAALIALCAFPALAQDRPSPELFVGYSHQRMSSGVESSDFAGTDITDTTLVNSFKVNGFNVSGTGYLTRRFGITGDFSAGFERRLDDFGGVRARTRLSLYNITVGPQVKFFNARRATPFVHALFGVARRNLRLEAVDAGAASIASATDNSTNFTMNLGGGLDVRLNGRADLRVFQLDYNPIFLRNRTVEGLNLPSRTAHGMRLSVGLVLK